MASKELKQWHKKEGRELYLIKRVRANPRKSDAQSTSRVKSAPFRELFTLKIGVKF